MLLQNLEPNVEVLEAGDIPGAQAHLSTNEDIELCLLDLVLPQEQEHSAVLRLRRASPKLKIVVVSGEADINVVRRCFDAGAMGFIPKTAPPHLLRQALIDVMSGKVYFPAHVLPVDSVKADCPTLTPRQREVLHYLKRGWTTKIIASELGLSEHTVKEHLKELFRVLGSRSRTEAVMKAVALGL